NSSPWRCPGGCRWDELCDPYYLPSPTTTVMWLVRLRMRVPRPLARAMKRFRVGPSSTMMVLTLRASTSAPLLFSALAMADSTTFLIRAAAFLSENFSRLTARSAGRPRTWSATRRAFCGEMRAVRRMAFASMVISLLRLLVAAVTLEGPGDSEFAELVADHVLVDENRHMVLAVVHSDGESHHFRQGHGMARPGLAPLPGAARGLHPLDEVVIDERAFLERTWHGRLAPTIAHDELLGALVLAGLVTLGRDAPRGDRMRVALAGLGLTTTVRVVDGVHGRTADGRANAAPTLGAGLAQLLQVVPDVADFPDGGAALDRHLAHFARTQAKRGVALFASDQLDAGAGGTRQLGALAGLHLDAVHGGADRDVAQRQGIARADRGVTPGNHLVA